MYNITIDGEVATLEEAAKVFLDKFNEVANKNLPPSDPLGVTSATKRVEVNGHTADAGEIDPLVMLRNT